MANRLRVTELDFDEIKTNLKQFLKQQSEFTDYDFDGAGLNVLLDILAYNTHYNAYYLNMIANEAFLDTALLRDSVVSHAKTLGYIPYSSTAPRAIINFKVQSASSTLGTLTLPKGYQFLSNQIDGVVYSFVTLDDITVTKANSNYLFEDLEIHEGQLVTYKFVHDESSNPKQIFTLPESNIDTDTLKVSVSPSTSSTDLVPYNKVRDILDVQTDSKVYFLQENRNGKFQIYFGNNYVGQKLPDGSVVYATYLVTNGPASNKANNFIATQTLSDSLTESLSNFTITPLSSAAGGTERESVDSIKFGASAQYATQNRLVTTTDYEAYVKRKYPSLDSISVWSGEENNPPVYGKVFISLKPKEDYYISELEKEKILKDIIDPKSIVSISAEIKDPEYLYLLIYVAAQYDPSKTLSSKQALTAAIRSAIINYKNVYLNKFQSKIVDSKLEYAIDITDVNAIIGNELTMRVQKRFTPTLNSINSYVINFNVPLYRGTTRNKLSSTEFVVLDTSNIERTVRFEEIPQSYTGVYSVNVINPGFGYTTTPNVTITGDGTGATAKANIVNGRVESIQIENRGFDYSRAIVSITGGGGREATAVAVLDDRVGALRTVYFDSNAERRVVDTNVGTINYLTGEVKINDIDILSVIADDGQIRIDVGSDEGIIQSYRNTIITIDEQDPNSILIDLEEI